MHPLLTFASGLIAGIVGVRLLNKAAPPASAGLGNLGGKARDGLAQAQTGLRDATVSGLSAIEKSSASLRARLAPAANEPAKAAAKPRVARKASAPGTKARTKTKAESKLPSPAGDGTAQ